MTRDFENEACFKLGSVYQLEYHEPSLPGVETGISLL
jgi:hypothetical protein